MEKFAKVVELSDGTQSLRYFEPYGDELIMHQVFQYDFGQIDAKITFNADTITMEKQESMLDEFTAESALDSKHGFGKKFGLV